MAESYTPLHLDNQIKVVSVAKPTSHRLDIILIALSVITLGVIGMIVFILLSK